MSGGVPEVTPPPEVEREELWRLLCDLHSFAPFTDEHWRLVSAAADEPYNAYTKYRTLADSLLAAGYRRSSLQAGSPPQLTEECTCVMTMQGCRVHDCRSSMANDV